MSINTEEILSNSQGGLDIYKIIIPNLTLLNNKQCKNVRNPFYDDKKPSLSIFKKGDRWFYKDFGEETYQGDAFNFCSHYFNLDLRVDFLELLTEMNTLLKNGLSDDVNNHRLYIEQAHQKQTKEYIEPPKAKNQIKRNEYFKKFGITPELLDELNVFELDCDYRLEIGYFGKGFYKKYIPSRTKGKFFYIGDKPNDYVFDCDCYNDEYIKILTGGEKDALTLRSLGFPAFSLSSETNPNIPESYINDCISIGCKMLIMYDIDDTGLKESLKFIEKYKFLKRIVLPDELKEKGGTDISDYVALGLSINVVYDLIDEALVNHKSIDQFEVSKFPKSLGSEPRKEIELNKERFSKDMFEFLPDNLKEACLFFSKDYEKDIFLLSALSVISAGLPNVTGVYHRKEVGANFNTFIIAPASSGKGSISWAKRYATGIHQMFKDRFEIDKKEFQSNSIDCELTPIQQLHLIPANTSSSALCETLSKGKERGLLFETEADTLSNSLASDWGNFSDLMRKTFHHESVSLLRRANKEHIELDSPKLSVVLSGTPNQVKSLIPSACDGLLSRFTYYDFVGDIGWLNVYNIDKSDSIEEFFNNSSIEFLNLYNYLEDKSIEFRLTKKQEEETNEMFTMWYNMTLEKYGENSVSIIKRLGLVHFRICMILSVINEYSKGQDFESVICDDNSFKASSLIIETLIVHSYNIYNTLPSNDILSKMTGRKQVFFDALALQFNRVMAMEVAESISLKEKTAEYYLKYFVDNGLINKPAHNSYIKIQS